MTTIFKICFKDSIHEEVDERDRLYCRDALLYQPNFLQVSFLYKFRNKQAQAWSQTPFVPSKGLNMEMKLVSVFVTFSFHRSLSASWSNYKGVSEFFSWDTTNERTFFRKNVKHERLHEGVSQWLNCCILSNLPMMSTVYIGLHNNILQSWSHSL